MCVCVCVCVCLEVCRCMCLCLVFTCSFPTNGVVLTTPSLPVTAPERATCPAQGQCVCLPGFRGPGCTEVVVVPTPEPPIDGLPPIGGTSTLPIISPSTEITTSPTPPQNDPLDASQSNGNQYNVYQNRAAVIVYQNPVYIIATKLHITWESVLFHVYYCEWILLQSRTYKSQPHSQAYPCKLKRGYKSHEIEYICLYACNR